MGTHDRVSDIDELFERTLRGGAWRKRTVVVVGVRGVESDETGALLRLEQLKRGAHVEKAGVAAGARRKFTSMKDRRRRRALDVGVIGVKVLEQPGAQAVAAEADVTELGA